MISRTLQGLGRGGGVDVGGKGWNLAEAFDK